MRFVLVAAVAAAFVSAPAVASEFDGPRVNVSGGMMSDGAVQAYYWSGSVGYDVKAGPLIVGAAVEYGDTNKTSREISGVGRVGYELVKNNLLYAVGGYSRLNSVARTFQGPRYGVGIEGRIMRRFSMYSEYRFTDYGVGLNPRAVVFGATYRF